MRLTPALLLQAYAAGLFPMAQAAGDDELSWFDPDPRGILPLDAFHVPRRLARTIRQAPFEVTADRAFDQVLDACAGSRADTWINQPIRELYGSLHREGAAHSIECWHDGQLAGGLYGVALGGAFFGESMFSRMTDASKVALVHLVWRLRAGGYTLLDTQFLTSHLANFGAIEISRARYRQMLAAALVLPGDFHRIHIPENSAG